MALLSVPVIVGTGAYAVMRMVAPTLLKKLTQQGVKNIRKVPKTKLSSVPKSTPRLTTNDAKKLVDGKPITRSSKKLSNKKTTPTETKRPEIKMSSGPSNRKMTTGDKAIMGTIGTLGAGAAIGAIGEKLSKQNKKLPPGAFGGKISKGPKRVNTVRPYKSPIKSNKKMKDELARQEKIKNNKKNKLSNTKATNVKNPAQEKRLSKFASENIAATNRKQSSNGIAGPSKASTKRPARSVAEAQKRGLSTFTNKKGKVLAAITKEQLSKSGKGLTPLLNAQKKSGKSLSKYLESEGIIKKRKPTTKKMGGGKVYRRGGGQALRGFGKATYSNKMY